MEIRDEKPSDAEGVYRVVSAAFGRRDPSLEAPINRSDQNHRSANAANRVGKARPDQNNRGAEIAHRRQVPEAELVEELRRAGDSAISLVAEEDGEIVGHVLLSKMEAPFRALALAPVSVGPGRQRCGIGSALIRSAVNRAREEGWAAIFVLGEPSYYERFGFDAAAAAGFTSPYAGEHFMVLALGAALPVKSGELRHARAFGGKR